MSSYQPSFVDMTGDDERAIDDDLYVIPLIDLSAYVSSKEKIRTDQLQPMRMTITPPLI